MWPGKGVSWRGSSQYFFHFTTLSFLMDWVPYCIIMYPLPPPFHPPPPTKGPHPKRKRILQCIIFKTCAGKFHRSKNVAGNCHPGQRRPKKNWSCFSSWVTWQLPITFPGKIGERLSFLKKAWLHNGKYWRGMIATQSQEEGLCYQHWATGKEVKLREEGVGEFCLY